MALDVGERLLGDAPHLPLLQDRQAGVAVAVELDSRPLRSRDPADVGLEGGGHVLAVGDVGAQVVEGVADLADHAADVVAELLERRADVLAPARRLATMRSSSKAR